MYCQELYSVELLHASLCICVSFALLIVISRKGECSDGLETTFITDTRSVGPDQARGFLRLCFFVNTNHGQCLQEH